MKRKSRSGSVRPIAERELESWCACPLDTDAWIEGERTWVARWHKGCANLFAFVAGEEFLGKYDVPMASGNRWTLWAPSVRDGPDAAAVMEALCAHARDESRRRGISRVEVTLEESHHQFDLAQRCLESAGFALDDERIVVTRDLTTPLPERPDSGLEFRSASELPASEVAALGENAGMTGSLPADGAPGCVACRGGAAVGLALPSSRTGEPEFRLHYIGLVPEARGQGYGLALLLEMLHRARATGFATYVGSTSKSNRPMLRVFERAGCGRPRTRLVFRLKQG